MLMVVKTFRLVRAIVMRWDGLIVGLNGLRRFLFYKGRLQSEHGIQVSVPDDDGRTTVHDIIYDELCQGVISPESRQRYLDVVVKEQERGTDGVIFGCTEVGLLLTQDDFDVPAFDSTALHVGAAIDAALGA